MFNHQSKTVTNFRQNNLGKRGNTGYFKYTKNAICCICVIYLNALLLYANQEYLLDIISTQKIAFLYVLGIRAF